MGHDIGDLVLFLLALNRLQCPLGFKRTSEVKSRAGFDPLIRVKRASKVVPGGGANSGRAHAARGVAACL